MPSLFYGNFDIVCVTEGEKMKELKVQKENMERVTKMVADEVQTLKAQCDRERESARLAKIEADRVSIVFIANCISYIISIP